MADGKVKAIEFEAELRRLQTMADGSVRITLDLPEYCTPQAKVMLDWLNELVRLVMTLEPASRS